MSRRRCHVRVSVALLMLATVGLTTRAQAQQRTPAPLPINSYDTYQSRSEQFIVTGIKPSHYVGHTDTQLSATNYILLETGVVPISCERVKVALLRELGLADQWRGRIRVRLLPEASPDQAIILNKEWFQDGWQYQIFSPHHVEPSKFLRATVWALLLELANRNNTSQTSAEIPLWLVEGLSMQLLASDGPTLILEPRKLTILDQRRPDVLQEPRARFKQQPAVSFADLSVPTRAQLEGAGWESFRCSAHLFVVELTGFADGRARLQELLRQLPNFFNGQLAFMHAFRGHFQSVLDVEKWWSATLVNFTGRDQHLRWSQAASLQRLNELLQATVEVRGATNALPRRSEIPLQRMIEQTDFARQKPALVNLAQQLQSLQWNAPPDLSRLVRDYRNALLAYVQKRDKATDANAQAGPGARLFTRELVQQLDMLDVIRDDFRKYDRAEVEAASAK